VFRYAHEWFRDTPRLVAGLSGYQMVSLAMAALGVGKFLKRGPSK
jgi:hypothetical protein